MGMDFEWDRAKSDRNARERGLPFDMARLMEWDIAMVETDSRKDYGEARFNVTAPIGNRVFRAACTRRGERMRIISFRRAHPKEVAIYMEWIDAQEI